MEEDRIIKERIEKVLPLSGEKQSRLYLGAESQSTGWGGQTKIAELSGKSRFLIARGGKELQNPEMQSDNNRMRHKGAGRKKEADKYPEPVSSIREPVSPYTVGDPESLLLWTSRSIRHLQDDLRKLGYGVSHEYIRQTLIHEGYSMQSNRKTKEGGNRVDRDAQFEYINNTAKAFIAINQPVISVDCKKKELTGKYKNNGQEWHPSNQPVEVNVYDFTDKTKGKAAPYGVCDIANNRGFVSVGISHDTSEFAVATIRKWWNEEGKMLYKYAENLYITADGGGSNGSRNRLWKTQIQEFANETGLKICVSHFPPGTSRRNKIEHRLFSPYINELARKTIGNIVCYFEFDRSYCNNDRIDC